MTGYSMQMDPGREDDPYEWVRQEAAAIAEDPDYTYHPRRGFQVTDPDPSDLADEGDRP